MVKSFRNLHFFALRVMIVILSTAFFFAVYLRPSHEESVGEAKDDFSLELNLQSDSFDVVSVTARSIKTPSCIVYLKSSTQTTLVGQITKSGVSNFRINKTSRQDTIELYDAIHKAVIRSFPLRKANKPIRS